MNKLPIWENSPQLKLVVFSRQLGNTSPHRHSFYELSIVLKGACTWHLGSRKYNLRAGQAILIKPQSTHCEVPSPDRPTELAWLGFDFTGICPAWSERILSLGEDLPEVATYFAAVYREHSSSDPITRKRVVLALQSVLVLAARRAAESKKVGPKHQRRGPKARLNSRQTRSIESAAHYFRQNFQDSLSVAQVAAYHSFCPAHFSTLFRKHYRIPPRAFLQQVKLEKAEELLVQSDLTLKEIGARCNFVDAAHLAKAFKKRYRSTPGAYRHARRRS